MHLKALNTKEIFLMIHQELFLHALIAAGFHVGEWAVQFPRNTQRQGIIALECCNMGTDPSCWTHQCPASLQGASVLPFTFLWAACPCHLRKLITGPEEEPEFFFFQLIFLCIHRSGTSMVTFKTCFWSNSSSWAFRETFSLCPKPKHWKQTTEWGRELGMTQFAYPRTQFVLDCVTPARCLANLSQGGPSSDVGSLLPSWTHQQGERSPSSLVKLLMPRPISCGHSLLLFTHL